MKKGYSVCLRRLALFILYIFPFILLSAAPVPTNKPASYPAWWFERDVISRLDPNNATPLWPGSYPSTNDYGLLNQGQLKNLATKAAAELDAHVVGGSGSAITTLIQAWQQPPAPGVTRDDYAVVNHGQLKNVAKLFYDRLMEVHYAPAYPWASSSIPASDYAVANIGQAKHLFSFDAADSDGDGMPNGWEVANGFDLANGDENNNGILDALDDADADGVSNLDEQLQGRNPHAGAISDSGGQLGLSVYTRLE